ncbi:MAG: tautomerase family protein [Planctomycetes bacterium]|nr:tautomerase family protein [Planctomycetota bacterium]
MPIITIEWLEGRTDDTKRKVAKEFTETLQREAGSSPEAVSIIFHDLKKCDLAKAGILFSDK